MGEKLRIYLGGLGSSVQEDDLKKTFTSPQLGTVESVEIIRSKGRSFGYLEYVPASDKGLAKLFSTYNGCMWKGGRLKLEKAKENYLSRLRREWTEDAELELELDTKSIDKTVDADESFQAVQKPAKYQDIEKIQLKIFFPKLRKIKPIPLKGTGKHKYSFQRVEVPTLPIHFCDCEEHCGPPESAKVSYTNNHDLDNYVVNENELNMMKSILNKFLDKENSSHTVPDEAKFTEKINNGSAAPDNWQVDDNEEDEVSDEDGLVINIVRRPIKKDALFENWGQKTTAVNKDFFEREPESFSRPIPEMLGNKKGKLLPDKKRKQPVRDNYPNDTVPSKKDARKRGRWDIADDPVAVKAESTGAKSGVPRVSSQHMVSSHKPAKTSVASWKQSGDFRISDILTNCNSEVEDKPRSDLVAADILTNCSSEVEDKPKSDLVAAAPSFNEECGQEDQSSKDKKLEKLSDAQSSEPLPSKDKSGRGASWLHKSSWLQLVGDTSASAFSISEILPGVSFEKQQSQQLNNIDFSNSRSGKQQRFSCKDQNSPAEAISKPEGQKPNFELNQKIEKRDEASAANVVPSNRPVGEIVIGETCPIMRSAASMKEWAKTKAALSGGHKKKGNKRKDVVQD